MCMFIEQGIRFDIRKMNTENYFIVSSNLTSQKNLVFASEAISPLNFHQERSNGNIGKPRMNICT